MKRKIKVVVADIDGTLTLSRKTYLLDLDAVKAIRELENRGIKVVLVTGNAFPVALTLLRYLGASAIVCENGCIVWYKGRKYELAKENIKREFEYIFKKLRKEVELSWQHEFRKYDFVLKPKNRKKWKKVVEKAKSIVNKKFSKRLRVLDSGYAIHFLPAKMGKAKGVKKILELLKVRKEEVVGVGDGENDLEIKKVVGKFFALSNSARTLKKEADFVLRGKSGKGFVELAKLLLE